MSAIQVGEVDAAAALLTLPKAELHLHLESSIRPSTATELGDRYGRPMPRDGPFPGLKEFVAEYEVARDLIGSLDDLRRVASELVDHAVAQGVVWSEVHLIPPSYSGRLGPDEAVLEAVLDGFGHSSGFEPGAGVILGVNRGLPMDAAERSLKLAVSYADKGVVGLGLAGDERNNPASRFSGVFARGREAGLPAVPHGGEASGAESVRACVEELGASRVCHGVRAVEDPAVVDLLVERGVCIDVCPSSNVSLQVSPSIEEHPLPLLLEAGVPLTLNSDGPLFSGVSVNDEYRLARMVFSLDWSVLKRIAQTSLTASSCPDHVRLSALRRIQNWSPSATPA